MKRNLFILFILFCFVLSSSLAFAGKKEEQKVTYYVDKFGKPDTCRITVEQEKKDRHVMATVSLFNDEKLAAMTIPLRFGDGKTPIWCDSISFKKTRVDFFQLKSVLIDSTNQIILIGLIADLSGKVPSLGKGNGDVAYIYFTLKEGAKTGGVTVDTTYIRPSNTLKLVTEDVKDIIPYWDNQKAKINFKTAK